MRAIPSSFDAAVVAAIDRRLDEVAATERARIPLAIESGSRAWDFASPDSDYDCRFLYLRRRERYLSLYPVRDVIETPLDPVLDVNGWDIGKALQLIVKGNAVVLEWLSSPIVYRGDDRFRRSLADFAAAHASRDLVRQHYRHLGERQWRRHGAEMPAKKLFYSLRPAAVLRWMRLHGGMLPPMHFPTLMDESDVAADVRSIVDDLLARKAETRELGTMRPDASVAAFITAEYAIAARDLAEPLGGADAAARSAADALFLDLLDRYAPHD